DRPGRCELKHQRTQELRPRRAGELDPVTDLAGEAIRSRHREHVIDSHQGHRPRRRPCACVSTRYTWPRMRPVLAQLDSAPAGGEEGRLSPRSATEDLHARDHALLLDCYTAVG